MPVSGVHPQEPFLLLSWLKPEVLGSQKACVWIFLEDAHFNSWMEAENQ